MLREANEKSTEYCSSRSIQLKNEKTVQCILKLHGGRNSDLRKTASDTFHNSTITTDHSLLSYVPYEYGDG